MVLKLAKVAIFASATVITFAAGVGAGAISVAIAMTKAVELSKENRENDDKDCPEDEE